MTSAPEIQEVEHEWRHKGFGSLKNESTYTECRELQPQDEASLDRKVPWDVVEHKTEGEALEEVEEAKDDPVGEPLDVIVVAGGFYSLDGEVGGQEPAEEVGDRGREGVDRVEEEDEGDAAEEGIALWDLRALLKGVESRVLCELWEGRVSDMTMAQSKVERGGRCRATPRPESNGDETHLFVELAEIVVGLVLCLDEGGVLVTLSGHDLLPTRRRKFVRRGCEGEIVVQKRIQKRWERER